MKILVNALDDAKQKLFSLKGKSVNVSINKGRGKYEDYVARIVSVYPSVFSLVVDGEEKQKLFSYNDILCGKIKFL